MLLFQYIKHIEFLLVISDLARPFLLIYQLR